MLQLLKDIQQKSTYEQKKLIDAFRSQQMVKQLGITPADRQVRFGRVVLNTALDALIERLGLDNNPIDKTTPFIAQVDAKIREKFPTLSSSEFSTYMNKPYILALLNNPLLQGGKRKHTRRAKKRSKRRYNRRLTAHRR